MRFRQVLLNDRQKFYHVIVKIFGQFGSVGEQLRGLLEVGDSLPHLLALLGLDAHVEV